MKLEVGMYVRTKAGTIAKITRHEHYWINKEEWEYITTDIGCNFEINLILKASNNIIDLIEVGDFISYIYPSGLGILGFEDVKVTEGLLNILQNGKNNHEYTIKSIVTKEQFESMKYSLEG